MPRFSVFLIALAASTLSGQQSALVGVWRVSFAAGRRIQNGETTVINRTGTLTIAAKGDSLIGELVADSSPGLPMRPPTHLAAAAGARPIVFSSRTPAVVNVNGARQDVTAVSAWTLQASGDSLSGTLQTSFEGFDGPSPEPSPVTGTRRKG